MNYKIDSFLNLLRDEVKRRMKDNDINVARMAVYCDMSIVTFTGFIKGTHNVSIKVIKKIEDYLEGNK